MNKKWIAILLIAMFVWSFLPGHMAFAESTDSPASGDADKRDIFFDERVFRGTGGKQDAYFEIGKGLKMLPGSSLNLYISHSETLLPKYSTLTILIDDVPFASTALDESNQKETLWNIDISSLNLSPGYHKITFWAQLKTTSLICEDPQNISSWLIVHRKSKVHLLLGPGEAQADLRLYPGPFLERGSTSPMKAVLAVPDHPDDGELRAAAQLSQFLARQVPTGKLNIPVYTESELTESILNEKSVIWVGQAGRWHNYGKTAIESFVASHPAVSAFDGYIGVAVSRWNAQLASLFLDAEGDRLMNAARILSVESLFSQLQGAYAEVPERFNASPFDASAGIGERRIVTLEELGYNNLVTEYVLEGSSTIQYVIPNHWDLSEGATLHLVYKHSRSILYDKSVMTVKLNNVPVQSVKLVEATSNRGIVEIPLEPAIIGTSRTISIEIGFQFANPGWDPNDPAASAYCTDTLLGDWAVVENTSFLSFTPHERETFNLDSLPFPFVANKEWQPTTVVLKDRTASTLSATMTWFGLMATDLYGADIQFADAADANAETLRNRHIVYVGLSDGVPHELNGTTHAFVQFAANRITSRSDVVELLPDLQRQSAIMQLVASPFGGNRYLLHLAATDRDLLSALADVIADPDKSAQIAGRIIAVDSRREVFAFLETIDARKTEQPTLAPEPAWNKKIPYVQYIFIGACVFLLAGIIVLIIISRKQRRTS